MKTITITLFIYLFVIHSFGQAPSIQWQKSLGGGEYEYAKEVALTSDGGSIAVGFTESIDGNVSFSHGGGDCWVVKTNASGSIDWEKSYGGTGFDYGYSIQQTTDGGFIVAGYSESNDGDVLLNNGGGDSWIMKLNNTGVIQWQKNYGGSMNDNAQCIRQTIDGGYIVAGNSESSDGDVVNSKGGSDCWILKLDDFGMIDWQQSLGGSSYDYVQDIKQTPEGGYVLCGGTHSTDGDVEEQNGNGDVWIVKLNNIGNITWEHSFGGSNYDFAQSIELSSEGGYILAGYSESSDGDVIGSHGGGDFWVIKCNDTGNLQWQKSLGSSGNDYAYCVKQTISGGYILAGYAELNDGDVSGNHGIYDCWLVELNTTGVLIMQKSFGGSGVDIAYSICQTSSMCYTIAGYSESNDGDVTGNHGNGDSWVIKLNSLSVGMESQQESIAINVSPNPSNGNFIFSGLEEGSSIVVYDVAGKIIFQENETNHNHSVDISNHAKGIYFYNVGLKNGGWVNGKIILN